MLPPNFSSIFKIQAIARGNEARKKILDMKKYYKENEDKVIKIQAQFRAKTAGEHYRALSPIFYRLHSQKNKNKIKIR